MPIRPPRPPSKQSESWRDKIDPNMATSIGGLPEADYNSPAPGNYASPMPSVDQPVPSELQRGEVTPVGYMTNDPLEGAKPVSDDPLAGAKPVSAAPIPAAQTNGPDLSFYSAKTGLPDVSQHPGNFYDKVMGPLAIGAASTLVPGAGLAVDAATGAGISVANDLYDGLINTSYGKPSGLSVGGELKSAATGAVLGAAVPQLVKGAGLHGAADVARTAATEATETGAKLAQQQSDIKAEQAAKVQAAAAKYGPSRNEPAVAKIKDTLAKDQQDLQDQIRKSVESQREDIAPAEGKRRAEGMIGKTPGEFAAQEADPEFARVAAVRAKAQAPFFDSARAMHEEVGAKFEPYIGPIRKNPVDVVHQQGLSARIADVEGWAQQNGQNISDPELNKIFTRIKEGDSAGDEAANAAMEKIGIPAKRAAQMTPAQKANYIQQAREQGILTPDEGGGALTYGELWGYRARANKILAKSNNPAVRYAAHQFVDDVTEMLPNVPQAVRNEYSTERSLFPPALARKVAQSRNPQEVGEAIFGSKADPTPAQVPLNIIRRATTPEAQEGLKTAFADRYLGNRMQPEDLAKMNPNVIKALYGDDAKAVYQLLGADGKVKSAPWEAILQHSPEAQKAFTDAWQESVSSSEVQATMKAVREGQKLLDEFPRSAEWARIQAEVAAEKLPKQKLDILQKQMPDPTDAAVQAVMKLKPSRMESIVARRGVWIGLGASLGGYRYLWNNPLGVAVLSSAGAVLGGRAAIRYALTKPGIAKAFVNVLSNPANARNAATLGRFLAGTTEGALLQGAKASGALGPMPANQGAQTPTAP